VAALNYAAPNPVGRGWVLKGSRLAPFWDDQPNFPQELRLEEMDHTFGNHQSDVEIESDDSYWGSDSE